MLGTIRSISGEVFDQSLIAAPVTDAGTADADAVAAAPVQPEPDPLSKTEWESSEAAEVVPAYQAPEAQIPPYEAEHIQEAKARKHGRNRLRRTLEKLKASPATCSLIAGIMSISCIFIFVFAPVFSLLLSMLCSIIGVVYGVKGLRTREKALSIAGLILSSFLWIIIYRQSRFMTSLFLTS